MSEFKGFPNSVDTRTERQFALPMNCHLCCCWEKSWYVATTWKETRSWLSRKQWQRWVRVSAQWTPRPLDCTPIIRHHNLRTSLNWSNRPQHFSLPLVPCTFAQCTRTYVNSCVFTPRIVPIIFASYKTVPKNYSSENLLFLSNHFTLVMTQSKVEPQWSHAHIWKAFAATFKATATSVASHLFIILFP